MTVEITVEEFTQNSNVVFGITDKLVCQLYHFFKNKAEAVMITDTHFADFTYKLVGDYSVFTEEQKAILASYGIMTDYTTDGFVRQNLFIIIPKEYMYGIEKLTKFWERYKRDELAPGYCVLEEDFSDNEKYNDRFSFINSVIPNCTIINAHPTSAHTLLTANKAIENLLNLQCYGTKTGFEIIDISHLFKGIINASNGSIERYVTSSLQVIEQIKSAGYKPNQILYAPNLEPADKNVYLHIAAYLQLMSSINFQIDPGDRDVFLGIVRDAIDNRYLFCEDFLNHLKNFPDFSISLVNNRCYLYVKNYDKVLQAQSLYEPIITMHSAPIQDFKLLQDFSKTRTVLPLSKRQGIKHVRDLCDIGSNNYETAMASLKMLDTFTRQCMRSLIKQKIIANGKKVSVNNMLIYEQGGSYYVGYIVNIDMKLPFFVYPMREGYQPFEVELSLEQLQKLLNPCLFFDAGRYIDFIKSKDKRLGRCTYNYDSTLRGIILHGYGNSTSKFSPNCELTIAEIGMWSRQTSDSRSDRFDIFASIFNRRALLQTEDFYSYFGLLHPSDSTTLHIHDVYWRDPRC